MNISRFAAAYFWHAAISRIATEGEISRLRNRTQSIVLLQKRVVGSEFGVGCVPRGNVASRVVI